MNKKGSSLGAWVEGIIMVLIVISSLIVIGNDMNLTHNKQSDWSLGLATNDTINDLVTMKGSFNQSVQTGQASSNSYFGVVLTSTWGMLKTSISLIWGFIAGNWIPNLVSVMHLPASFGLLLQLLYYLGIGFIILRILLKVGV